LQTGHQDDGRRLGREVDVGHPLTHGGGQLLLDDADQHLPGRQRGDDLLTQRLVLDAGNEVAHHGKRHVSLQQRHAHLTQHVLHVGFGDAGLAAHGLDQATESFSEVGCHEIAACARKLDP